MSVPRHDFVWQQGEDGLLSLVYRVNGATVDLSGYKARMDIRNAAGERLFTFNSDDIAESGVDDPGAADNEAVMGSDGTIQISVPRSASLSGGPLEDSIAQPLSYDVFLRDTQNKQRKILKGTILLEPSSTQWN